MRTNNRSDEQINWALSKETQKIEPSEELFNKIKADIHEKECEKTMKSKTPSLKKGRRLTVLVASFVLLCSVTALGVTMIKGNTWVGHSSTKYKTFPKEERILKDVGFSPKYMKSLPGGFEYVNGSIGESKLSDETGDVLTQTKHVTLAYRRDNDKPRLDLSITQVDEIFLDNKEGQLVGNFNGISLYYDQQDYKFVPADYELTEEDKKATETGKLEISFGTPEIEYSNIQSLSWYEDGLEYRIMGSDYGFTVEEMIDMATPIIDQ